MTALQVELAEAERGLLAEVAAHNATRAQLATTQAEIDRLNTDYSMETALRAAFQNQLADAQAEVDRLRSENIRLRAENTNLHSDSTTAQTRLTTAQTEIERLKTEVLKQGGRADGLRDRKIELQAQLATLRAAIEGELGHVDNMSKRKLRAALDATQTAADGFERLKNENDDLHHALESSTPTAEVQLATLRTAAERAVDSLYVIGYAPCAAIRERLRDALDATPTTVDPRVTRLIEAAERYLSTPHTGDQRDANAHDSLATALNAIKS